MKFNPVLIKVIIGIIISVLLLGMIYFIMLLIEKNTDISQATHAIVMKENTEIKGSFWMKEYLSPGTNVYLLEEINENDILYYKVKWKNRIGKIKAEDIAFFKFDDQNEYALMSDVSKFNKNSSFTTTEEYEFFLLNTSINYVYIRAGGRGYGKARKFLY